MPEVVGFISGYSTLLHDLNLLVPGDLLLLVDEDEIHLVDGPLWVDFHSVLHAPADDWGLLVSFGTSFYISSCL